MYDIYIHIDISTCRIDDVHEETHFVLLISVQGGGSTLAFIPEFVKSWRLGSRGSKNPKGSHLPQADWRSHCAGHRLHYQSFHCASVCVYEMEEAKGKSYRKHCKSGEHMVGPGGQSGDQTRMASMLPAKDLQPRNSGQAGRLRR
jgi:hypothetical protein